MYLSILTKYRQCSGGFSGGSWGSMEPPFGLDLVLRSTDDRLNGTPPSSLAKESRKPLQSRAHLSIVLAEISIENGSIDR